MDGSSSSDSETNNPGVPTVSRTKYKRGQKKAHGDLSSGGVRQRKYRFRKELRKPVANDDNDVEDHWLDLESDQSSQRSCQSVIDISSESESWATLSDLETEPLAVDESSHSNLGSSQEPPPRGNSEETEGNAGGCDEGFRGGNEDTDCLDERLFVVNKSSTVAKFIADQLNTIVVENSLTRKPINQLLGLLRTFFPKLPRDARTLRQTPRSVRSRTVHPGTYAHIGIHEYLRPLIERNTNCTTFLLDIFVDGVAFHNIAKKKEFLGYSRTFPLLWENFFDRDL